MSGFVRRIFARRGRFAASMAFAAAFLGVAAFPALAADIKKFSPEGEIGTVAEVRVQFSAPMVAVGDRKAPAPFQVSCPVPAQSYWDNDSVWVLAFEKNLPSGLKCQFTPRPKLAALNGELVRTKPVYVFNTGGPRIMNSEPGAGSTVEEQAAFVLTLSAPANLASVKANAYCSLEGVADRVPLNILEGKERQSILESALGARPRAAAELARYEENERHSLVVQCAQAGTPKARMSIVWGAGIQSLNGIPQTLARRIEFKVRDAFMASMSCERENAQAPCTPIRPITVSLSTPIPIKLAEQIRLKTADGTRQPRFTDEAKKEGMTEEIKFMPPFPEKSELTLDIPRSLQDDSGRSLANAKLFPLIIKTADAPPLAKFASPEFGLIERKAEPVVPITLRRIELPKSGAAGQVRRLAVDDDFEIMRWFGKLRRSAYEEGNNGDPKRKDSRALSLLAGNKAAETMSLPKPKGDPKEGEYPFEVVGLPMPKPGFFVLELESEKLGAALLDDGKGARKAMYVKTLALVTNLSVHFRQGASNSQVWVTTLDKAMPVKDASVRLTDCNARMVWEGKTDAQGLAIIDQRLAELAEKEGNCADDTLPRYMVTARARGADGVTDLGLVLSNWNMGIETWRFNLPSGDSWTKFQRHRAVLDRTLLRAGETVSFKLFSRQETLKGLALLGKDKLPRSLEAVHVGSGDSFPVPIEWRDNRYAKGQWKIPKEAKLGAYDLRMVMGEAGSKEKAEEADGQREGLDGQSVGTFRVSEFKLPSMTGRVQPKADASLIAPAKLPVALQLDFLSSGPAANHAMSVSALLQRHSPRFEGYEQFKFREVPAMSRPGRGGDAQESDDQEAANERRLIADKLPAKLDAKGAGVVTIEKIPTLKAPAELQLEASYADANGEIQTLSNRTRLWPAAVVIGLKTDSWVSVEKALNTQMVVLDTQGRPLANQNVEIIGRVRDTLSTRKRLVGGFYAYDNSTEYRDLGRLCSATTNAAGIASCKLDIKTSGNVELIAQAKDGEGRVSQTFEDIWVTERGELWFDGENHDRVDLLPEKRRYKPGETARFQVRMPFRYATALVSVERDGVIDSFTVALTGKDPTIEVPVKAEYGPNVFVSALIVRERLREVPWYSFFQWGWRAPADWWKAFRENLEPTATVDLAKPAHKLGIAEIQVGLDAQALKVTVKSDQPSYQVRGQAKVRIAVTDAQGKPLPAGTALAFAAVDQALLELGNNDTWDLLEAMWQRRGYDMETYTAQMHIVGKRHYGRKAAPPGGGGGMGPTRELFDTLLLWNPEVVLNEKGEADIVVPLNDSLTRFKLVAVADHGTGQFGTGSASIETKQDLQMIAGLPTQSRFDDSYRAGITLRNTTAREMKVEVQAALENSSLKLPAQVVSVAANGTQELFWNVSNSEVLKALQGDSVPKGPLFAGLPLAWTFTAREQGGAGATVAASDRVKVMQTLSPSVKPAVQHATLLQLGAEASSLSLGLPPQTLPGSGMVQVNLSKSLLGSQAGLRQFFTAYPFACLEQRTSKAIGLRDEGLWRVITSQLALYLDGDGLAMYFPAGGGTAKGYDILTSYVLSVSHEAGWDLPDAELARMHKGLTAFVEGKITREFWSPQKDLAVRKLAAIEALSRRQAARPAMLESITEDLVAWPTQALIDYYQILKRMPEIRDRDKRLKNTDNALRARLSMSGNRMSFANEQGDYWWWLMGSADLNANRLIAATMGDESWNSDISKLVTGSLARQQRGTWATTTANVWGSLMLEKFAKDFERVPVSGQTRASFAGQKPMTHNWTAQVPSVSAMLAMPESITGPAPAVTSGATAAAPGSLQLQHAGEGRPWAQINVLAAVQRSEPVAAGYRISKTMTVVDGDKSAGFKRGDMVRVRLTVTAAAPMTWVVLDDPIPAGAVVQGRGLDRDSALAGMGQQSGGAAYATFQEIGYSGVKSYFDYVPKGEFVVEYTMRLNTPGDFVMPATRAEAMYAPEVFGEAPNARMSVK